MFTYFFIAASQRIVMFSVIVVFFTFGNECMNLIISSTGNYKTNSTARVLYIPAYAFGLTPWRTLIWIAGFASTITMLAAALL